MLNLTELRSPLPSVTTVTVLPVPASSILLPVTPVLPTDADAELTSYVTLVPGAWKEIGIGIGGLVTGAELATLPLPPPPPPHPVKDSSADRTTSVPMTVDRIFRPFEDNSQLPGFSAPAATVLIF